MNAQGNDDAEGNDRWKIINETSSTAILRLWLMVWRIMGLIVLEKIAAIKNRRSDTVEV